MATQIASLFAKVTADTADFEKKMGSAKTQIGGMSTALGGLTKAGGVALGAGLAVGGAAVAGFGAVLVKGTSQAMAMEQSIADIQAVFGTAAPAAAALQDKISELGLDPALKVTAVEAGAAIEMLAKNGADWADIEDGMARSTILLANATGGDFTDAADIATDAMAQFGFGAEDMTDVVNQITGVTQNSKIDLNQYGLALAAAGGVAAASGVEFDDFNATLAAIVPNMSGGSDAGTSLKTMLSTLIPKSKDAEKTMRALGIITEDGANQFFDAAGNMKSMQDVSEVLSIALSDLSEIERGAAADTIFGSDAKRAAFALMKAGTEGEIKKYKDAIGNTDAEAAAELRMDTLAGQWEIFMGQVDGLTTQLGTAFLPIFRDVVDWLVVAADKHGPALIEMFKNFVLVVKDVIKWVVDVVQDGFDPMAESFKALPEPVQKIITNIDSFITTTKNIIDPIVDAIGKFVSFQDILIALGVVITGTILVALYSIITASLPLIAAFVAITAAVVLLRKLWEIDWQAVGDFFGGIVTTAVEDLSTWGENIGTFVTDAAKAIGDWVIGVGTDLGTLGANYVTAWVVVGGFFADIVSGGVATLADMLGFGSDLPGKVKTGINSTWGTFTGWLETTWEDVTETPLTWESLFDGYGGAFIGALKSGAEALWPETMKSLQTSWDAIVADPMGWALSFAQYGADIVVGIQSGWDENWTAAETAISNAWTLITDGPSKWATDFLQYGKDILVKLKEGYTEKWGEVKTKIGEAWTWIITQPAKWATDFLQFGRDIIDGIKAGITEKWTAFKTDVSGKFNSVVSTAKSILGIASPSTVFKSMGENVVGGFQEGLDENFPAVLTSAETFAGAFISSFDGIGSAIETGIIEPLGDVAAAIKTINDTPVNIVAATGPAHTGSPAAAAKIIDDAANSIVDTASAITPEGAAEARLRRNLWDASLMGGKTYEQRLIDAGLDPGLPTVVSSQGANTGAPLNKNKFGLYDSATWETVIQSPMLFGDRAIAGLYGGGGGSPFGDKSIVDTFKSWGAGIIEFFDPGIIDTNTQTGRNLSLLNESVADLSGQSIGKVLDAIFQLIATMQLRDSAAGTQYDVNLVSTGNDETDLLNVINYLNALNGT